MRQAIGRILAMLGVVLCGFWGSLWGPGGDLHAETGADGAAGQELGRSLEQLFERAFEDGSGEGLDGDGALGDRESDVGPVTKLPLPRFVSLRSSEINVRRGPGLDYRKDWVFRRAGLPVKVIDEYGDWRRIMDSDEAGGWVYHSLLSGRRTVLVTADMATLRDRPVETAIPVAKAERGVVASLRGCEPRWCEIEIQGVAGWALREQLWGVDGDTQPQD